MDTEKIVPAPGDYAEADRTLTDVTERGAAFWRAAGAVPGQRARFVDESLSDALRESLARERALSGGSEFERLKEEVAGAQTELGELDVAEDFSKYLARAVDARVETFHGRMTDLVKLLVEKYDERIAEIDALKDAIGALKEPQVKLVRPAARGPRQALGSTTLQLPGLAIDEPVVNDVVPTSLGKVDLTGT